MTRHLLDSSVWLAVTVSGHEHHRLAREWFQTIQGPDSFHFCRSTQQSFLRLLSTAAFHAQFDSGPLSNEQAWNALDQLLADERVRFQLEEPDALSPYWRLYSSQGSSSPKLWMDAYLAAFARAGGYRFVTLDKAFRQFDQLDLLLLTSDP